MLAINLSEATLTTFGAIALTSVIALLGWIVKLVIDLTVKVTRLGDLMQDNVRRLDELEARPRPRR